MCTEKKTTISANAELEQSIDGPADGEKVIVLRLGANPLKPFQEAGLKVCYNAQ